MCNTKLINIALCVLTAFIVSSFVAVVMEAERDKKVKVLK